VPHMLKLSLRGAKRGSNLLNIVSKILKLSKFTKVLEVKYIITMLKQYEFPG